MRVSAPLRVPGGGKTSRRKDFQSTLRCVTQQIPRFSRCGRQRNVSSDIVHQIHSWWNFWHRICTESCLGARCGESRTEPSLFTTHEQACTGPSQTSVESALHGVFQRLRDSVSGSSRRSTRFFDTGLCQLPYLEVRNVSVIFSIEPCDIGRSD